MANFGLIWSHLDAWQERYPVYLSASSSATSWTRPSPPIAQSAGIDLHTAIRWVKHAQRDWADYIAARTAEQAERASRR